MKFGKRQKWTCGVLIRRVVGPPVALVTRRGHTGDFGVLVVFLDGVLMAQVWFLETWNAVCF